MSAAAERVIGSADVQTAWHTLAGWVLDNGFRPELIAIFKPTAAQLAPLTELMTATSASALEAGAASQGKETDNVETITSVGVVAHDGTLVPGESGVTDRVLTEASADVDTDGNLIVNATSSANIHYTATADPAHGFHSKFERNVTYTLVQQDNRWLIETWRGTYTTSDPIDD